jgi:hypothetical protein
MFNSKRFYYNCQQCCDVFYMYVRLLDLVYCVWIIV